MTPQRRCLSRSDREQARGVRQRRRRRQVVRMDERARGVSLPQMPEQPLLGDGLRELASR